MIRLGATILPCDVAADARHPVAHDAAASGRETPTPRPGGRPGADRDQRSPPRAQARCGLWIRLKPNGNRVARGRGRSGRSRARRPRPGAPPLRRCPASPPAHRLDDLDRADAVGHRPGHAGKSRPVRFAKRRVSQLFQPAGRDEGDEPLQVLEGRCRGRTHDQAGNSAPIDDQERFGHLADCALQRLVKPVGREQLHDATPRWTTAAAPAAAQGQPPGADQHIPGMSRYTSRNARRTEAFGRKRPPWANRLTVAWRIGQPG